MSFGRTGIQDWLAQRVSAVVLLAFFVTLGAYFVFNPALTFTKWQALYANIFVQLITFLAIACVAIHAWIGMWTVLTDYVKSPFVRNSLLSLILLGLAAIVLWSFVILWI